MKLQEKAEIADLGIYLHIPFCARSCDFCHFYQEVPQRSEIERFLSGMERQLRQLNGDRYAKTVFFGGGTPGVLAAKDLERLCKAVLVANGGRAPREWTVEMAPATVKPDKIRALRDYGVNRISMGVQSFDATLLAALGRIHSQRQVWQALETLAAVEVPIVNLDLIFAIPGQTPEQWQSDLSTALSTGVSHVSTYCLTFEEDTALWLRLQRGQVDKQSEWDEAVFFELAWQTLGVGGMEQYEISNYARPGHACLHNINTWRMQEWLGFGPSASSQYGGRRWTEPHSMDLWLDGLATGKPHYSDEVTLTRELLAEDALTFGLRMNAGVSLSQLVCRLGGRLPETWRQLFGQLIEAGYAEIVPEANGQEDRQDYASGILRLTPTGRLLADRIAVEISG